jgi:glycerol kinase
MQTPLILAIDQGTSSTKALVFSQKGEALAKGSALLATHYLPNGFVEQDPEAIYQNVLDAVTQCLAVLREVGGNPDDILACGISNQRETFMLWDANGKPVVQAMVWQCKRSVGVCEALKARDLENLVKDRTGLTIDPYFSATKLIWLVEQIPGLAERVGKGEIYFGTVDTWLLYRLTNGEVYATDHTNASRTLLFNLHTLSWDPALLEAFGLTGLQLPQIHPSSFVYGHTDCGGLLKNLVPIGALIGDSHAAAFGEGLFAPGMAKATLGTGCSLLMNVGSTPVRSGHGMVTTVCWSMQGRTDFALEGIIVSCGATIEWLRQSLRLFTDSQETEALARSVPNNQGVYLVPAFSGLGAPHWEMARKAKISGLTLGTSKAHIIRAALESIAYQVKDVIAAMEEDLQLPLHTLVTDGGISANQFVMEFMAGLLGVPVHRMLMHDVSAMGAAWLSGISTGIFVDLDAVKALPAPRVQTLPDADPVYQIYYEGWKKNLITP